VSPCQFQCSLVGLGTAVAKKALTAKGPLREHLSQLSLLNGVKGIIDVQQFTSLFTDGLNDLWMAVPDPTDGPSGKHIQNSVTVKVLESVVPTFCNDFWESTIIGNDIVIKY
jgi:hypothetical protein